MMTTTSPSVWPISSPSFWKAYWIHMRPYLLFVSGIAGFSGVAFALQFQAFSAAKLFALLPFFLGYGFGQALTDAFQMDTDSLSAAYRPLSQGIIAPKQVIAVSLGGLILCSVILAYFNWINLLYGTISVIGLATYSYFKKHYWYIGPFYNAVIVAILPLMGYACFSDGPLFTPDLKILAAITFLAYGNFVIMGYLKDITADRATGYQTFPVVWGWDRTVWMGNVLVAAVISLFLYFWADRLLANSFSGLIFLIASGMAVYGQVKALVIRPKVEGNAKIPIINTVRSFILWMGAAVLLSVPALFIPLLIFYGLFEFTLFKRPEAEQI